MMTEQIWTVDGGGIRWEVGKPHRDDVEMSGLGCDLMNFYGSDEDGCLIWDRRLFFPALRTIPNDTHATFGFSLGYCEGLRLMKNGRAAAERPTCFRFDGILTAECTSEGFLTERRSFPSRDGRFAVELIKITASEETELEPSLPELSRVAHGRGTKGVYLCEVQYVGPRRIRLSKGESAELALFISARIANESLPAPSAEDELEKRRQRIAELCDGSLIVKTGIPEIDVMARLAKLRAGESIFSTVTGTYHSPGGQTYYAATWCNDQVEYAGPHFAMTGDRTAIEASLNAYMGYTAFMSDLYTRIPSSIIAEGLDIWEGAGDRGDAAMYLYGGSLFALYLGERETAERLWPWLEWCAEYCRRRTDENGVVCSESDELEGRFPTDGKANLSTSCLCCGGLIEGAKLARSLGKDDTAREWEERAAALKRAIEDYFGATLHGYETYRYSKGFDTLRAWICLPLCIGIEKRAGGTLEAMLSEHLWTEEGMLTCERSEENRSETIWDRSTLYGMKAAFAVGAGDRILPLLRRYCRKRLLCDRVPYPVEAYPEGDKRHLSGESALFVRTLTEGLFGIRPEGLDSFSFVPRLCRGIGEMRLEKLRVSGGCFDLSVSAEGYTVTLEGKTVACGPTDGRRVTVKR